MLSLLFTEGYNKPSHMQYSILPTCIVIALFFLSLLTLCTVPFIIWVSSFPLLFPFSCSNAMSNIRRSLVFYVVNPLTWLTIQTVFGELVVFVINPPWHGWWHEAIWWVQHIAVMLLKEKPIVFRYSCYSVAFWRPCFPHYLLCMVHSTDFSLMWRSLRLTPIVMVIAIT